MNPLSDSASELCRSVRASIVAEHDGEAVLAALALEHARQCPECRAFQRTLRDVSDRFEPLRAPVPLPPELWARIEARATNVPRVHRARTLASLGAALLGAAAVLALFAALGRERAAGGAPAHAGGLARPFDLLAREARTGAARLVSVPEIRLARSLPHSEDQR